VGDFLKYVGRTFEDTDDGGSFKITGVCEMRKTRGRKSTNKVYAFKYVSIEAVADDLDALEYTPARELLNCYWCKWTDAPADSGRAARASRRGETTTSEVAAVT
jgi:hypothetical protein